jgi:hypothetical protein
MAVLIAFLLGENSPFVGGPFHVADTVVFIVFMRLPINLFTFDRSNMTSTPAARLLK